MFGNAVTVATESTNTVNGSERLTRVQLEVDRMNFVVNRAFPLLAHFERLAFHPSIKCQPEDYEELQVAADIVFALQAKVRELELAVYCDNPDIERAEKLLAANCKIRPPYFSMFVRMLFYSNFRLSLPITEVDQVLEKIFLRLQQALVKGPLRLPMPASRAHPAR